MGEEEEEEEEERKRSLIKDLKRHARLAVAWSRHSRENLHANKRSSKILSATALVGITRE